MLLIRQSILACALVFGVNLGFCAEDSVVLPDLTEQLKEISDEPAAESDEDAGQKLLDEAVLAKMSLEKLSDADKVINYCRLAISKGLNESNTALANELIRSTYIQRGTILTENLQQGSFTDDQQLKLVVDLALQDMNHVLEYLPKDSDKESFEGANLTWYNIAYLRLLKDKKDKEGLEALAKAKRLSVNIPNLFAKVLMLEVQTMDNPEKQIELLREAQKNDEDSDSIRRTLAQVLTQLKRFDEALEEIKPLMDKENVNPVDMLLYASLLDELKRPKEALEIVLQMRKMLPKSDKLLLMELRLAVKLRDDDLILKTSDEALKSQPEDETLLLLRGAIFAQKKQFDKAIKELDQLLFFQDDNYRALELKIEVLYRAGKKDESWTIAQDLMDRLVADKKADPAVCWALYDQLKSMEKSDEALAFAEKISSRSEDDGLKYLIAKATTLLKKEKKSEAIAIANEILDKKPKSSFELTAIAILAQAEDYEAARKAYQDGAKKNEKNPEIAVLYVLGEAELLVKMDDVPAALKIVDPKVENKEASDDMLKLSIGFYRECKQPQKVVAVLDRLIERNPQDTGFWGLLTYALMDTKEYKRVNEVFAKLIELSIEKERDYNNYGWFLCTCPDDKARDGKKALEMAQKAAELSNFKESYILSTLAAAFAENGNFDKALEWIQKGLDVAETDEMRANLKKEQESYKAKKPWREQGGLDQID